MSHASLPPAAEVVVQLLDASQGIPLKTWKFHNCMSISIGRGEDCEVEVIDPYVSRIHAVLEIRDQIWVLASRGRNGVYVDGQPVKDHAVSGDLKFRLGPTGPLLAFKSGVQRDERAATLSFDTIPIALLGLDEQKLQEEVTAISNRGDFQRLQEQAQALRRKRAQT